MSDRVLTATDVQQRPATRRVPGEAGLWLFLFGDMFVFTFLFAVFLTRRAANSESWAESQSLLDRDFGAVNTVVLLTSSLVVVWAVVTSRAPNHASLTRRLIFLGAGVGSCFVIIKILEYHDMVSSGITPMTNEFFMYYYALTGLHLIHVLIGLGVLVVLGLSTKAEKTTVHSQTYLEGGACFWHMVDLLWIFIFPLVFLVG